MSTPQEERPLPLRSRRKTAGLQAEEGTRREADGLPSRRVVHPSNKYQTAKWFYNALIVLFLALMAGLFLFGRQLSGG